MNLENHINIDCQENVDFGEVLRDLPLILKYCDKSVVTNVSVIANFEETLPENAYSFNDGNGTYSIVGLFNSLN